MEPLPRGERHWERLVETGSLKKILQIPPHNPPATQNRTTAEYTSLVLSTGQRTLATEPRIRPMF